jgi:hypothetical protein
MRIFAKENWKSMMDTVVLSILLAMVTCMMSLIVITGGGGVHQVLHHAGCDLSNALEKAPHGFDLLEKFPIIGELGELEPIQH